MSRSIFSKHRIEQEIPPLTEEERQIQNQLYEIERDKSRREWVEHVVGNLIGTVAIMIFIMFIVIVFGSFIS